jgi:hypothetical protein
VRGENFFEVKEAADNVVVSVFCLVLWVQLQ